MLSGDVATVIGLGTVVNVVAILVGSALGVALGHRLPQRTRDVVTDGLGLITMLVAALSAAAVLDASVEPAVGAAGVLIVLGSVLIGGIIGSLLRIEARLEGLGASLQRRLGDGPTDVEVEGSLADPDPAAAPRGTFVEGFVTASLVFCVGPLAILGSLSDGLGLGIEQLALKSTMDGFASIAFAASLGWGVAASALVVGVYQGTLTLVGWGLGSVLSGAQVALLTATGGLLLVGISLRLLRIRQVPVGDLLPALLVAPLLTALVAALR
ncbi:MAG: DUF554 domain-containing protein [Candidatus Nanopelagicales bacterium]|nr:DUF554 domain-containing protein [Candidatus Nanopelagicales bacterium]